MVGREWHKLWCTAVKIASLTCHPNVLGFRDDTSISKRLESAPQAQSIVLLKHAYTVLHSILTSSLLGGRPEPGLAAALAGSVLQALAHCGPTQQEEESGNMPDQMQACTCRAAASV